MHEIEKLNGGKRQELERIIAKRLKKLVPRKVRNTIFEMIRSADGFDPRRPAVFISQFQSLLQEGDRLASSPPANLTSRQQWALKRVFALLRRYPIADELRLFAPKLTRIAKQEAMRNPRASLLLKLINQADQNVSLVSMIFLYDSMQSLKRLRCQLEPADLLASLDSTTGGVRARAYLRAYRETAEWLYEPYLRVLWNLTNFAFNEDKILPKNFGPLVEQLSVRLRDYPGLVDAEAGWRRNAASHTHWEYDEKTDALTMWM